MLNLPYKSYQKPLILAPHPDDLEGFVGGLAYLLPNNIVSVVFAGGNQGVWDEKFKHISRDEYIRVRLEESERAAKILGVKEIVYMGYLDRQLTCDEKVIAKTLAVIQTVQPDVVIGFEYLPRATPYPHPDHLAAANIVRHALARYPHHTQLDYYLCSTLLPNRFVDISKVRLIKLKALAQHNTQRELNQVIFPFFEKMLSKLWGMYSGIDYAEGYRKVNLKDMLKRLPNA